MKIKTFALGQNYTNCYCVYDPISKEAFAVDICEALTPAYFSFISTQHLRVRYLFLTHGHYDHTDDILHFKQMLPETQIVISALDYQNILNKTPVFCSVQDFPKPILVEGGERFQVLEDELKVLATPGHTNGSLCFVYKDCIFSGDTVFYSSVGRTDLPTGSFSDILRSVKTVLELGDYRIFPGHMDATDTKTEKRINSFYKI